MSGPEVLDETCGVFGRLSQKLDPTTITRFVVGEDLAPRAMTRDEIADELDDALSRLILAGTIPRSGDELMAALDAATQPGDPLRAQASFVVGEGSQIAQSLQTAALERGLRFIVSRGGGADGPDMIISVGDPRQRDGLEVMAWDDRVGGFNYYRTIGEEAAWAFAGNSRHAVTEGTEGKGPFESHTSGAVLMKELRAPWNNWHSPDANILPSAFADDDDRRTHPWFANKELQGAVVLEGAVAKPSIARWTRKRLEQVIDPSGAVERPRRIMAQIVGTPTANLMSSHIESRAAAQKASIDLPQTFFVDSEALTELLGLAAPPGFVAPGAAYAQMLERFEATLTDGNGFSQPGETHFAFVIPERAFEDQETLRQALERGLISRRLAACLLMTDFPNPVFSARREQLLAHAPTTATISDGASDYSQQVADAVIAAAVGTPDDSPEHEFERRWQVGEDFKASFDSELAAYYGAVLARLGTPEGLDDYYKLAESRRAMAVERMPIFREFPLLFARSTVPLVPRQMTAQGTVEELAA